MRDIFGRVFIVIVAGGLLLSFLIAQVGNVQRVSISSGGQEGDKESLQPALNVDGRYVAFESKATNLVSGDTNNWWDIFVYDRRTNTITRVSVDSNGAQANRGSRNPAINADGRFVAFESDATNLITGDANNRTDIFVRDRDLDADGIFDEPNPGATATVRVSINSNGGESSGNSRNPSISADGRFIVFESDAVNLVDNDTNGRVDIFVHDRDTDADGVFDEQGAIATRRLSVSTLSVQANGNSTSSVISANSRYVAFTSDATNLVSGDTNAVDDVFIHDRDADGDGTYDEQGGIATIRVSVGPGGVQANGPSQTPSISADGRYVAFESTATNLVLGDTNGVDDVFVRDRALNQTTRVSLTSSGTQGTGPSWTPAISSDGRYVAFVSDATNLVAGDTNCSMDVFVRDRTANQTTRVSVGSGGVQSNDHSGWAAGLAISANGRFVAFHSLASNLVAGDTNGRADVFVY